jgi:hypothetical protein
VPRGAHHNRRACTPRRYHSWQAGAAAIDVPDKIAKGPDVCLLGHAGSAGIPPAKRLDQRVVVIPALREIRRALTKHHADGGRTIRHAAQAQEFNELQQHRTAAGGIDGELELAVLDQHGMQVAELARLAQVLAALSDIREFLRRDESRRPRTGLAFELKAQGPDIVGFFLIQ